MARSSNSSSCSKSTNNRPQEEEIIDPNSLLPQYLLPLVRHYHDDFYVSRSFEPRLIVQLMAEGFLPIATRGYLLPKLHVERCVLQLNPESKLHISKSTRKKSKRFKFSVNTCFDGVVAGCHRQHGTNWLYPQIVAAFKLINEKTKDANAGGINAFIMATNNNNNSLQQQHQQQPQDVTPVRLYSVEVWNADTGALAGGELGYSVGGIYSSLTGFSEEDAAGSVQLLALGQLLTKCGFEYWDLGMDLDYKRRLGAELIPRSEFLTHVHRSRIENNGVELQCGGEKVNAKELVDWGRPSTTTAKKKTFNVAKENGKQSSVKEEQHTTICSTSVSSDSKKRSSPAPRDEPKAKKKTTTATCEEKEEGKMYGGESIFDPFIYHR